MACIAKVRIIAEYQDDTKVYDIEGDSDTDLSKYTDAATGSSFFNLVTQEVKFATRDAGGTVTWN